MNADGSCGHAHNACPQCRVEKNVEAQTADLTTTAEDATLHLCRRAGCESGCEKCMV